jgi:hypothetical protein
MWVSQLVYIVDHALAQWADGLVRMSHGSVSCVVG